MLITNSFAESIRQTFTSACYIHLYNGGDGEELVPDGIADQQA